VSNDTQARAIAIGESRSGRAFYRAIRFFIRQVLFRYFRVIHHGREHLETPGPLVLAPVHRSNLDAPLIAGLSRRGTKSLGKESLFGSKPVAWMMSALGGFPVNREAADREALRAAEALLDSGASMIVFPEGSRQTGELIGEVYGGAAFLAARTGAKVVPIGVAGTEAAMPPDAKFPRRSKVAIIVGAPMDPPESAAGRVSLSQRRAFTADLRERLQEVFDEAQAESEQV
jgi:1-acyl-sn-glycerol-3-phosphate acyltransferase